MRINLKKASLTIEAACVMGLVLFTIVGTIYACLFIHNRTWLTAAAYEAAVTGSTTRQEDKRYQITEEKARMLGNVGFYAGDNLQCYVQVGKNIEVTYSQNTSVPYGNLLWKMNVKAKAKVIEPEKWIRKVKTASEIAKGAFD